MVYFIVTSDTGSGNNDQYKVSKSMKQLCNLYNINSVMLLGDNIYEVGTTSINDPQFKTKFEERKSWATSLESKQAHATFECLLHNLLLILEVQLNEEEGIYDEQSEKINQGRKRPKPQGYINEIVQRASHRSLKLIRWLRNLLFTQTSWSHALKRLMSIWCLQ